MSLSPEWRPRIEQWQKALEFLFCRRLAPLPLEVAFTFEQLTPAEAAGLHYAPIAPGDRWGVPWEYAWFRGEFVVPPSAAGESLVLEAGERTPPWGVGDTFGEWRILINGEDIGSRDWAHIHLGLTSCAQAGERFSLLAEGFGGPSRGGAGGGPAVPGRPTIAPLPARQRTMVDLGVGVWREEAFQLWHDAQTLLELRDQLDADSLRVAEIDAGLREFTLIADPELPWPAARETLLTARERLRPLLECRNGSTAPTLHAVGHSHLDVVYQWPFAETERKVARTFANQLRLLREYPGYRYLQSMPILYATAKRRHPAIYERVKAAVARGQWIPEGGMWTEADTNLPGGESLIRQFVHGKRFFRDEFGVESVLAWLPDVFGYSGALPQIFAGCGMKYFASAKIFGLYNGGDPFPYTSFWWEGIDGTRVLSHLVAGYGETTNPRQIEWNWKQRPQKDGVRSRLMLYGHSDGGGGAERTHLEFLQRCGDLEGLPRVRHSTPGDFFADLERHAAALPVYVGEIYFPLHRGTATTQGRLKWLNRRCEFVLREAELWSAAAAWVESRPYPAAALDEAWKTVLFNQFHDILPGSCVRRAVEEAEQSYSSALAAAERLAAEAAAFLTAPSAGAATVFNASPFPRVALVPVPSNVSPAGTTQEIVGVPHVEIAVPANGWANFAAAPPVKSTDAARATPRSLENAVVRVEFDDYGQIVSCRDLTGERELASAPLNAFRMYRDTPRFCEAWDIDSHYELQPVSLDAPAEIVVIADGPLLAAVRVRRTLHHSSVEQEIRLRRDSRTIEFRTHVRWAECHKLLKVAFPVALHATEAIHEIQFGHLRRPTHRSRPFDADRFEVCQQKWSALAEEGRGIALLNDSKYGLDARGRSLNLTLLRAPLAPDDQADLGDHDFTYAFHFWHGSFAGSGTIPAAYDLNVAPRVSPGVAPETAWFSVDAPNIVLEAVKLAEDGSGDMVLRFYEAHRNATRCRLRLPGPAVITETNMLENPLRPPVAADESVALDFRPFEIKTLRLRRAV